VSRLEGLESRFKRHKSIDDKEHKTKKIGDVECSKKMNCRNRVIDLTHMCDIGQQPFAVRVHKKVQGNED